MLSLQFVISCSEVMRIWLIWSLLFVVCYGASIDKLDFGKIVPSRLHSAFASRIYGGTAAASNQFPFYVYILAQGQGEASSCGGSLISANWVLTAAHCTYSYLSLDLYFGSNSVYDMTEILTSTYWVCHESYNPTNYNNDISVVELPQALTFSSSIQPVNLLSSSQASNNFVGQSSVVMGFGYMADSDPTESPDLLYTNVAVISNSACSTYYGSSIVIYSTMCAQGSSGQSICSGDSGGPMMISNGNGGYNQIGINSFVSGSGCTTGYPSGYIRVGSYLSWISKQTGLSIS